MANSWFTEHPEINLDHIDLNISLHKVKKYNHPHIKKIKDNIEKQESKYDSAKKKYKDYYVSIGKIKSSSSNEELMKILSDENKKELYRIDDLIIRNKNNLSIAESNLKNWNKLDREIETIVYQFNMKENLTDDKKLDPNLVKAVMFSETEMGTGHDYKRLIAYIEKDYPNEVWQLNLGRVTDYDLYFNKTIKEFKININWQTNYKDNGNKNDIMLAAGALIIKYKYAKKIKNRRFRPDEPWYNALLAFKGVSDKGVENANKAWKTYTTGMHPNTSNFRLFDL